MDTIVFEIPGNPQALKRHRSYRMGNGSLRQVDPSQGDKADFLSLALEHRPAAPFKVPLEVNIHCYFPRPKGHYRTGKNAHLLKDSAPVYHTGRPDTDNLAKFVCDSLNGIFWHDDSYIAYLTVWKLYSEIPRTRVLVKELHDGDVS